jgi:hypothetical protein
LLNHTNPCRQYVTHIFTTHIFTVPFRSENAARITHPALLLVQHSFQLLLVLQHFIQVLLLLLQCFFQLLLLQHSFQLLLQYSSQLPLLLLAQVVFTFPVQPSQQQHLR